MLESGLRLGFGLGWGQGQVLDQVLGQSYKVESVAVLEFSGGICAQTYAR